MTTSATESVRAFVYKNVWQSDRWITNRYPTRKYYQYNGGQNWEPRRRSLWEHLQCDQEPPCPALLSSLEKCHVQISKFFMFILQGKVYQCDHSLQTLLTLPGAVDLQNEDATVHKRNLVNFPNSVSWAKKRKWTKWVTFNVTGLNCVVILCGSGLREMQQNCVVIFLWLWAE